MIAGAIRWHLVDSSVWIPVLRRAPADALAQRLKQRVRALVASNEAATTGIVRLELLRGTRSESEYRELEHTLGGLHQILTHDAVWDEAGRLGARLRAVGLVVQTTDLLLAAVALRAKVVLVHRDGDFDAIAKHAPLLVESYV
jgi:predicted nucleic acid-binding protein